MLPTPVAEHVGWGYHIWEKCPATGDLVKGGSERENIKKPPAHILYLLKINIPCLPSLKPPESPLRESFDHLAPASQRSHAIFVSVPKIYD